MARMGNGGEAQGTMAGQKGWKDKPALICRNVTVSGRRTSLRMEPLLWDALKDICDREDCSLNELCTMIDERRGSANLTASLRVFIISYYRSAAPARPTGFGEQGGEGNTPSPRLRRALQDAVPLDD